MLHKISDGDGAGEGDEFVTFNKPHRPAQLSRRNDVQQPQSYTEIKSI